MSRAAQPFLDRSKIQARLVSPVREAVAELAVFEHLPSTNQALLEAKILRRQLWVYLAEHQTAGRGRLGRKWIAPPHSGLCLSLGYRFPEVVEDLPALTLAVGVTLAQTLAQAGAEGVKIKWPNDVWYQDQKLGGILTEVTSEPDVGPRVVVGIGVNLTLPAAGLALGEAGATAPIDLRSVTGHGISPSDLAANVINAVGALILSFAETGFEPFRQRYEGCDALFGRPVTADYQGRRVTGVAAGITPQGHLRLDTGAERVAIMAGDVELLRLRG